MNNTNTDQQGTGVIEEEDSEEEEKEIAFKQKEEEGVNELEFGQMDFETKKISVHGGDQQLFITEQSLEVGAHADMSELFNNLETNIEEY